MVTFSPQRVGYQRFRKEGHSNRRDVVRRARKCNRLIELPLKYPIVTSSRQSDFGVQSSTKGDIVSFLVYH